MAHGVGLKLRKASVYDSAGQVDDGVVIARGWDLVVVGWTNQFLGVPFRHNFRQARAATVVSGVVACLAVYAFGTFILHLETLTSCIPLHLMKRYWR